MQITKKWEEFNPKDYLAEYYSYIGYENTEIIKFLVDAFKLVEPGSRVIDVGTGPTVYQLVVAADKASEITFSDVVSGNISEINSWRSDNPEAFNWEEYTRAILELEGVVLPVRQKDIEKREKSTKDKLKDGITLDLKAVLPSYINGKFDVATVQFVPESITDSQTEYIHCLRNIYQLLNPKGILVMCAIKGANTYRVGTKFFPSISIDQKSLLVFLNEAGFSSDPTIIRCVSSEDPTRYKYHGLIFVAIRK